MQIEYTRSSVEDRQAALAVLRDTAYAAAYSGPQTVESMRLGTDALVQHGSVRKVHPMVQVIAKLIGEVPCEVITAPTADHQRIVLYIHGGAFIRGSLALGRANASLLAELTHATVVAIGYRQAPEHRYPAASNDVREVYEALLGNGISPGAMAVVGESSGGCLALGLAADLEQRSIALPAGIATLSPMTDLALPGASWLYNADKDVATREMGRMAIGMYIDQASLSEPVASPIRFHFKGCCPLFIGIGSHETMLSDTERLAHKADAAGVDVKLHIYEDMPHGFTRFETTIGTQALKDTAHWCNSRHRSA